MLFGVLKQSLCREKETSAYTFRRAPRFSKRNFALWQLEKKTPYTYNESHTQVHVVPGRGGIRPREYNTRRGWAVNAFDEADTHRTSGISKHTCSSKMKIPNISTEITYQCKIKTMQVRWFCKTDVDGWDTKLAFHVEASYKCCRWSPVFFLSLAPILILILFPEVAEPRLVILVEKVIPAISAVCLTIGSGCNLTSVTSQRLESLHLMSTSRAEGHPRLGRWGRERNVACITCGSIQTVLSNAVRFIKWIKELTGV